MHVIMHINPIYINNNNLIHIMASITANNLKNLKEADCKIIEN